MKKARMTGVEMLTIKQRASKGTSYGNKFSHFLSESHLPLPTMITYSSVHKQK